MTTTRYCISAFYIWGKKLRGTEDYQTPQTSVSTEQSYDTQRGSSYYTDFMVTFSSQSTQSTVDWQLFSNNV